MPVYDYECSRCGFVFEHIAPVDDLIPVGCSACGGFARRRFSPTPYLFMPYHLDDEERGRVLARMRLAERSERGRKVAEVAHELNQMPVLVES